MIKYVQDNELILISLDSSSASVSKFLVLVIVIDNDDSSFIIFNGSGVLLHVKFITKIHVFNKNQI